MASTRALSLVCSLALLVGTAGCSSGYVPLRPDGTPWPERCPPKALEAMRYVRARVGDKAAVELDLNQAEASPVHLYEGPVESDLNSGIGLLYVGTRLYGRVWTDGPDILIRYYEAKPVDGATLPICAEARLGREQFPKLPASKPGMAVIEASSAEVSIVDAFR